MDNKGNVALWASLLIGAVLVLGVGMGVRYYTQSKQPTQVAENIYRPGEMWRETKLPNRNIAFIKDHNLYMHNPSTGDTLITENIPKSLGLPPANYKVTLDDWFGEDPVLLTSDFYGFIAVSKEQDKFAFIYKRLQKDAITKNEGFYPYSTHSKLLVYSLNGKLLTTYELDQKKISPNYDLSYFDREKAVFEGATTKGPLPEISYIFVNQAELAGEKFKVVLPNGGEVLDAYEPVVIKYDIGGKFREKASGKIELYLLKDNVISGYIGDINPNLNTFNWPKFTKLWVSGGLDIAPVPVSPGNYKLLLIARTTVARGGEARDYPVDILDAGLLYKEGKLFVKYVDGLDQIKGTDIIASDVSDSTFIITKKDLPAPTLSKSAYYTQVDFPHQCNETYNIYRNPSEKFKYHEDVMESPKFIGAIKFFEGNCDEKFLDFQQICDLKKSSCSELFVQNGPFYYQSELVSDTNDQYNYYNTWPLGQLNIHSNSSEPISFASLKKIDNGIDEYSKKLESELFNSCTHILLPESLTVQKISEDEANLVEVSTNKAIVNVKKMPTTPLAGPGDVEGTNQKVLNPKEIKTLLLINPFFDSGWGFGRIYILNKNNALDFYVKSSQRSREHIRFSSTIQNQELLNTITQTYSSKCE